MGEEPAQTTGSSDRGSIADAVSSFLKNLPPGVAVGGGIGGGLGLLSAAVSPSSRLRDYVMRSLLGVALGGGAGYGVGALAKQDERLQLIQRGREKFGHLPQEQQDAIIERALDKGEFRPLPPPSIRPSGVKPEDPTRQSVDAMLDEAARESGISKPFLTPREMGPLDWTANLIGDVIGKEKLRGEEHLPHPSRWSDFWSRMSLGSGVRGNPYAEQRISELRAKYGPGRVDKWLTAGGRIQAGPIGRLIAGTPALSDVPDIGGKWKRWKGGRKMDIEKQRIGRLWRLYGAPPMPEDFRRRLAGGKLPYGVAEAWLKEWGAREERKHWLEQEQRQKALPGT